MKNHTILRTVFIFALLGCASMRVSADMNDLYVDDSFAYNTRQTVSVDIQVNTPAHDVTGLTFYSAGVDGLRLLDSRVIPDSGQYSGKINVPAYLKTIVVKSRWLDDFKEVQLDISNHKITAVIDHF